MRISLKITSPSSGSTKPPITLRVVVLPQPEGPSNVMNSLSLIYRLILFKICASPQETLILLSRIITSFFNYATPSFCKDCVLTRYRKLKKVTTRKSDYYSTTSDSKKTALVLQNNIMRNPLNVNTFLQKFQSFYSLNKFSFHKALFFS